MCACCYAILAALEDASMPAHSLLVNASDPHAFMHCPAGMETGTSAAAAGGVTTVVDMPLNSAPCTTTGERVKEKVALGKTKSRVNIGFWGGLVPENAEKPSMLQVRAPLLLIHGLLAHAQEMESGCVARAQEMEAVAWHVLLICNRPLQCPCAGCLLLNKLVACAGHAGRRRPRVQGLHVALWYRRLSKCQRSAHRLGAAIHAGATGISFVVSVWLMVVP